MRCPGSSTKTPKFVARTTIPSQWLPGEKQEPYNFQFSSSNSSLIKHPLRPNDQTQQRPPVWAANSQNPTRRRPSAGALGSASAPQSPARTVIACAGAAYLANSEPPSLMTFGGGLPPSPFNSIFRSSVAWVMVTVRPDLLLSAYFSGACHFIVSGPSDSPARTTTVCVPTTQPSPETVVVSVKRPSGP